jgi:hypothetical protein
MYLGCQTNGGSTTLVNRLGRGSGTDWSIGAMNTVWAEQYSDSFVEIQLSRILIYLIHPFFFLIQNGCR